MTVGLTVTRRRYVRYGDAHYGGGLVDGAYVLEATCQVTAVGRRSRALSFAARVVCRADPSRGLSAAAVLDEPIVVVTATGTVVVPALPARSAGTRAPS